MDVQLNLQAFENTNSGNSLLTSYENNSQLADNLIRSMEPGSHKMNNNIKPSSSVSSTSFSDDATTQDVNNSPEVIARKYLILAIELVFCFAAIIDVATAVEPSPFRAFLMILLTRFITQNLVNVFQVSDTDHSTPVSKGNYEDVMRISAAMAIVKMYVWRVALSGSSLWSILTYVGVCAYFIFPDRRILFLLKNMSREVQGHCAEFLRNHSSDKSQKNLLRWNHC